MDFEQYFSERLAFDLDNNRYNDAESFAQGITRHYMAGLALHAPYPVPPTMPAPALLGNPAPVGPAISINNYSGRRRVFYNTVRAYFVAKEIARGDFKVQSLAKDIQNTITLYKKASLEYDSVQRQLQDLDDRIAANLKDLKEVIPSINQFFRSKKELFKQLKTEMESFKGNFDNLRNTGLADFDFQTIMAEELADIQTLTNLKLEMKVEFEDMKALFDQIIAIYRKVTLTGKKYQNTFSREATLKLYFSRKIKAVLNEVLQMISGFFKPERYIAFWRELIFVPSSKRIATVMLRIINNNAILKETKKKLTIKIQNISNAVMGWLNRKIQQLQDALEEAAADLAGWTTKQFNLLREELKSHEKLVNAAKWVDRQVKRIGKAIAHYVRVAQKLIDIVFKIQNIGVDIIYSVNKTKEFIGTIKQRYAETINAFEETFTKETQDVRQKLFSSYKQALSVEKIGVDTKQLLASLQTQTPAIEAVISQLTVVERLTQPQISAWLRQRGSRVQFIINQMESILDVDIPALRSMLKLKPNDPNYREKLRAIEDRSELEGVQSIATKEKPHKTYIYLVKKLREAGLKLKEVQQELIVATENQQKQLNEVINKPKDAVIEYIDQLLEKNPKIKKAREKKRQAEGNAGDLKAKVAKVKKIATETQIAVSLVTNTTEVTRDIITGGFQSPVTRNQGKIRSIVQNYYDWEILRGKKTPQQKAAFIRKYEVELADLRAYEKIVSFGLEVAREARANNFVKEFRDYLKDKIITVESGMQNTVEALITFIEETTSPESISYQDIPKLARIPTELFERADITTGILAAERAAFRKLKRRVKNIGSFIPKETTDPTLRFIKRSLQKGSSWILTIMDAISKFFIKLTKLLRDLLDPVLEWLNITAKEEAEDLQEQEANRAQKLAAQKLNPDARIMSFMFATAAKLFWTGATWTDIATGTRYVVTSLGKFRPRMMALNENGAQGFAEELAYAFSNQLMTMKGLVIPNTSLGIAPFRFYGYRSKEDWVLT